MKWNTSNCSTYRELTPKMNCRNMLYKRRNSGRNHREGLRYELCEKSKSNKKIRELARKDLWWERTLMGKNWIETLKTMVCRETTSERTFSLEPPTYLKRRSKTEFNNS